MAHWESGVSLLYDGHEHDDHRVRYSPKHDAGACLDCDVWLEPVCECKPEDDCPFPDPRPTKPSEVT